MPNALAIDVGTTSVKVALVSEEGKCLGYDVEEYDLITPRPGWVEADPGVYWQRLAGAVSRTLAKASADPAEVSALALSSQGQTVVALDADGEALGPAMVWLDTRATEEARRIEAHFGRMNHYRHTGVPVVSPSSTSSMLLWIKEHEPERFTKTRRFVLIRDYIAYRMCGRAVLDETGAVSSGLYDLQARRWWPELLQFIGLDEERLSTIAPSGQIIGELTRESAAFLGLRAGTPLVSGAWDQVAAAVGSGNLAPGRLTEMTGTALAVVATTGALAWDPKARLLTVPHALQPKGILLPFANTSGIVLKWLREKFFTADVTYDDLTRMAEPVPPGANGVLFVPHFAGIASPSFDPAVRGGIFGLALNHTRADIVRALLESLAFLLRECVEILEDLGERPQRIRALGGGARSALLCQIKADVLGVPVETSAFPEAALLGDAMIALVGIGALSSLEEAAATMVHKARVFEPDLKRQERYEEIYGRYRTLCDELHPRTPSADLAKEQ